MRISKRCEYALRALIDLGIARELGRNLVTVAMLSSSEKIPVKFLEQILAQLRDAGYLRSFRGKLGGYTLALPLRAIVIGDIVRLMDGPLGPIPCADPDPGDGRARVRRSSARAPRARPCTCPDRDHCGLRIVMLDVRSAISGVLDRCTLAQVVGVTLRKFRRDGVPLPWLPALAR